MSEYSAKLVLATWNRDTGRRSFTRRSLASPSTRPVVRRTSDQRDANIARHVAHFVGKLLQHQEDVARLLGKTTATRRGTFWTMRLSASPREREHLTAECRDKLVEEGFDGKAWVEHRHLCQWAAVEARAENARVEHLNHRTSVREDDFQHRVEDVAIADLAAKDG
ncbi:MAG: hypothetical protein M9937_20535 [Chelatococcus sp.]|uniref:hypothetical protein n=1 Tax=Chelatococcus sp. TaxID=1953771 RepID=UPI00260AC767|nr:hypothetical protein [Chelatococcus sp.]MCO5078058.1 hypothetical protein [Chelatococcus sp.]